MKQRSKFDSSRPAALVFCDALALVCLGSFRALLSARNLLWPSAVHVHSFSQPPLPVTLMITRTFADWAPREPSTPKQTIQSP